MSLPQLIAARLADWRRIAGALRLPSQLNGAATPPAVESAAATLECCVESLEADLAFIDATLNPPNPS